MQVHMFGSEVVVELDSAGALLAGEDDALTVIGETYGTGADWVAIPASRLAPEFFVLSTKQAGGFFQKLANYNIKAAIIGDISAHTAESTALRDFVYECNTGGHIRFVASLAELGSTLSAA
ncbi:DUF4180 domain-containing protein [Pelagibacterium xiamenense]|uniref:DUF4180 domain-containing protein n=1 Tax=Pelagibacterium xiamenense TaxID=2901140 RepID=UPI001E341D3C|nr:DUF4180 domain-containing protein [Pelagibacterium xiamenense]MCD7060977.1 DUF4180 domain-containing protein [Pelagibacterium xiamenense]